jgi:hypothetical protein
MARKTVTVVRPPKAPDVKGMREIQKRLTAQPQTLEDFGFDSADSATVDQLRSHLHSALDLLDQLEGSDSIKTR